MAVVIIHILAGIGSAIYEYKPECRAFEAGMDGLLDTDEGGGMCDGMPQQ